LGADIHTMDDIPLLNAVKKNHTEVVQFLLEQSATITINVIKQSYYSNKIIVKLLLDYGADIDCMRGLLTCPFFVDYEIKNMISAAQNHAHRSKSYWILLYFGI